MVYVKRYCFLCIKCRFSQEDTIPEKMAIDDVIEEVLHEHSPTNSKTVDNVISPTGQEDTATENANNDMDSSKMDNTTKKQNSKNDDVDMLTKPADSTSEKFDSDTINSDLSIPTSTKQESETSSKQVHSEPTPTASPTQETSNTPEKVKAHASLGHTPILTIPIEESHIYTNFASEIKEHATTNNTTSTIVTTANRDTHDVNHVFSDVTNVNSNVKNANSDGNNDGNSDVGVKDEVKDESGITNIENIMKTRLEVDVDDRTETASTYSVGSSSCSRTESSCSSASSAKKRRRRKKRKELRVFDEQYVRQFDEFKHYYKIKSIGQAFSFVKNNLNEQWFCCLPRGDPFSAEGLLDWVQRFEVVEKNLKATRKQSFCMFFIKLFTLKINFHNLFVL